MFHAPFMWDIYLCYYWINIAAISVLLMPTERTSFRSHSSVSMFSQFSLSIYLSIIFQAKMSAFIFRVGPYCQPLLVSLTIGHYWLVHRHRVSHLSTNEKVSAASACRSKRRKVLWFFFGKTLSTFVKECRLFPPWNRHTFFAVCPFRLLRPRCLEAFLWRKHNRGLFLAARWPLP